MSLPKRNEHLKRSRLQERRGAAEYGGTVNSGSGNQWKRKNDVRTDDLSIEFKTTTKASYGIKAAELDRAYKNALLDGRNMWFEIEFANDGVTCVIMMKDDAVAMREKGLSERQ